MNGSAVAAAAGRAPQAERLASVIYVQPGARQRFAVAERLARLGIPVVVSHDVAEALRLMAERSFALVLLDLSHDRAALTAVRLIRASHPTIPVAAVVDPANPAISAEALHVGVTELLPWPFEGQGIAALIANARDRSSSDSDPAARPGRPADALVTQSPAMKQVLEQIQAVAGSRQHVCIAGERATGRSLAARTIHMLAGDPEDLFVTVDCGSALPHDLERELFGVPSDRRESAVSAGVTAERLSTTGAVYRASGGTLFLPNLAETPARVQARLARLLRDQEAMLVERRAIVELDVRAIVAVESDVEGAVADGRLRRDLAERVSAVRIDMPSLRSRREDIPLLVGEIVQELCEKQQVPTKVFSRSALALLSALPWPGNAAELTSLLDALVRSVRPNIIQQEDVLEHARLDGLSARIDTSLSLREAKTRFERECITAVLMRHHGRVGEAARALGIQRTNLYRKVRQLKVSRTLLSARR